MAYDENTAGRMRQALGEQAGVSEKRMMGGLCFFLNGNMIGGADRPKDGPARFMFRVGRANAGHAAGLGAEGPVVMGGRVMPGFYFVAEAECGERLLGEWLSLAVAHAGSLPPK